MKYQDVIEELKELKESADAEQSHLAADQVLCEFLDSLGYWEVVEAWEKVPKWYS